MLLADIYAGALTAQGFPVRVLPDLGARELVDPALMSGLVQVVPEYSGSALEFVSLGRQSATSDVTATGRALAGWVAGRGLVAGRPSAAQDANVIVVTAAPRPAMTCDRSPTWPGWRRGWCSAVRPNARSASTACWG